MHKLNIALESLKAMDKTVYELMGDIDGLVKTLKEIMGNGCENYTSPQYGTCIVERPDGQYAEYGADRWCSSCIAFNAVNKLNGES